MHTTSPVTNLGHAVGPLHFTQLIQRIPLHGDAVEDGHHLGRNLAVHRETGDGGNAGGGAPAGCDLHANLGHLAQGGQHARAMTLNVFI